MTILPFDGQRLARSGRTMLESRRLLDGLSVAAFGAIVLVIAIYSVLKPEANFDAIPYAATVLENRIDDPAELHRQSWSLVLSHASEAQAQHLQAANAYNAAMARDADAFATQLPMYRVKAGYVWLVRAIEPFTGLWNAMTIVSVGSGLLFAAAVAIFLFREGAAQGLLLVLPVLLIGGFPYMIRMINPDLAAALPALCAIFSVWKGRLWIAPPLMIVACLFRPDLLVLPFAFLLVGTALRWPILPLLVGLACAAACVFTMKHLTDDIGWWAHFYFSNIALQIDMSRFDPAFSIVDLARGYLRGVSVALRTGQWMSLLLLILACWAFVIGRRLGTLRQHGVVLACLMALGGKFLAFPLPDDRFYFLFIAAMAILLAAIVKPRFIARPSGGAYINRT